MSGDVFDFSVPDRSAYTYSSIWVFGYCKWVSAAAATTAHSPRIARTKLLVTRAYYDGRVR